MRTLRYLQLLACNAQVQIIILFLIWSNTFPNFKSFQNEKKEKITI